jgi:hypothetical protein
MVATLVARNANVTVVAHIMEYISLHLAGICSLDSGGRFCIGAFRKSRFICLEGIFTFNIFHKKGPFGREGGITDMLTYIVLPYLNVVQVLIRFT